jgi:hypothetical protein
MLYECKRTATVTTRNYTTLGKLQMNEYREIISAYKNMEDLLRERIIEYDDPLKTFLVEAITKISYFHNASE